MKYRDENGIFQDLYLPPTGDTLPIGSITEYAGENVPYGWLICDGTAVSRIRYKELFQVIGTTYGEGDGLTTFNLPDMGATVINNIIKAKQTVGAVGTMATEYTEASNAYYNAPYVNEVTQDIYSTDEVKTNKIWINNKPIYRKVLTGSLSSTSNVHNISNISEVTYIRGMLWQGDSQASNTTFFPINTVRPNFSDRELGVYINKTQISFDKGSTLGSSYNYYVIVEYTKTTD